MKSLGLTRLIVLLSLWTALLSLALAAGFTQAAPLSSRGGTGQALALSAALRGFLSPTTRTPTFQEMGVPASTQRGPDGRYIYSKAALMRSGAILKRRAGTANAAQVNEAVQTFDVFNPPPGFTPTQGPSLTPTNLTPVWTAAETMLVFSSNRTASGSAGPRFHLWAIPINGGAPVQLTDSPAGPAGGGEFFPTLSSGNNSQIAFTSDAQSPGVQNLYTMPFTAAVVDIADSAVITSPTIRTDAAGAGGTGFDNVQRPTFSPTNSDQIIFSAHSTAGNNANHYHIYYLFASTGGYDPTNASLPAKITDGPADDFDPAYSEDGQLIAFASTAPSLTQTNTPTSADPNSSLILTGPPAGSGTQRSIFLIGGGGRVGFGNLTNSGSPVTLPGSDNFGPAWSSPRRNAYLNPAPGTEYLAFARGASASAPHDIYYLAVLKNIDAGGESGRSNEEATTPLIAGTPVDQVDAGAASAVTDANFPGQVYEPDNYAEIGAASSIVPVQVTGGQADPINTAPVNTLNDPNTPPAVYTTDRSGTFTYAFQYLTHSPTDPRAAASRYRVRLHLADPKDNKIGQRQFTVSLNGVKQSVTVPSPTTGLPTSTTTIDIVQLAQASPGKLNGLVSDAATNAPIAGATLTVTDYASGAAVVTNPSPLTTTAGTSPPPSGTGSPINYAGTLPKGTYVVTVTPPAGSGYSAASQVVNVNSGFFARADFALAQGTGTINGTVDDSTGKIPIIGATITVTDAKTGVAVATNPASVVSGSDGSFTETLPAGSYYITATPPATSGYAVQTQAVTVTNGNAAAAAFLLASGAAVGVVGGLVTDSVSGLPIAGATIKVLDGTGAVIAITQTTAATTSPAAPGGDGKPVNYSLVVPLGTDSLQFSAPGYAGQSQSVTVVNTPAITANGTTTPANEFVRADKALVNSTPNTGQNTAVVLEFSATAPNGVINVAFAPVAGDPPIVQALELISDSNPATSSGFGDARGASASAAPTLISALGGVVGGQPQVTVTFENSLTVGTPSSYNLYRTNGSPTTENNPPVTSQAGTEGNTPYQPNLVIGTTVGVNIIDAGKDQTTGLEKYSFTDTGAAVVTGTEYYYQITAKFSQNVTPETAATDANGNPGLNPAVHLNTDDNAGQTSAAGNVYDDIYPTWSPFVSVFSIAYSSNRTVTYNNPAANSAPAETAISVGQGGSLGSAATVGASYTGILESQVLNLDPPTLLPYSGNEIVHVADSAGNTTRYGIQPGQPVTFTVRLSSREAGIDNGNPTGVAGSAGGADPTKPQVFIQIKDPDSKYQDAQQMEHKVFAKDYQYRLQVNNTAGYFYDSGSSSMLMNGGPTPVFGDGTTYAGFNQFAINKYAFFSNSNGTQFAPQRGSIGGIDGPEGFDSGVGPGANGNKSDTIAIGSDGGGTNPQIPVDGKGNPILDSNKNVVQLPGGDPSRFIPWGPEYECQVVNPQFAVSGGSKFQAGDTGVNDYAVPYYLAGVDDQQPFSGAGKQRPTTSENGVPAEWLQLTRLPDAQQDGQGGVLYSVTWTTPTSGSDYYLDVIAFDKAVAPPVSSATSLTGAQSNWRIYDNVWGFSTAASLNNNDILVVSDYALGQKFAATTFGGQSGLLNLIPKLYGAESYVTDIDISILPNAIYRTILYSGADGTNFSNYTPEVLDMAIAYDTNNQAIDINNFDFPFRVLNGLGVGSYVDKYNNDGDKIDGVAAVRSQQYSLWRILSRGPVPNAVFQAYEPSFVTQPAVNDPGSSTKINVAAGRVPVANRCILWLSPFTGDVLAGPGTLIDAATQTSLRNFVAAGGRLCISGQDVGSSLTQGGTVNNGTGGFLSDVLNATLKTANGGTHLPVATGTSTTENRITNYPYFDGAVKGFYPELSAGDDIFNTPPGQRLIRVSNNYGGNIFASNYGPLAPLTAAYSGNWRTDGSLDELGPYIQPFPATSNNALVSQIDTITPNAGANVHTDITLSPFTNPLATTGFELNDPNAASGPGGVGLIYSESPITATGGTGSKVVYSTFGLEALSTEYYKQTITSFNPNAMTYLPRNQRQNILHNIVCYLRTGSISGTVISTTGNGSVGSGVPGVTVYLVSAFGVAIPGRGTYSAMTDAAGNYRIDGIEPGSYTLAAYRTGFTRTTSDPNVVLTIEGDTTLTGNLTISQATGGSINGTVTDGVNPVPGATVTFTSSDGTTESATTDANGKYNLPSVPPNTYTGIAAKLPGFGNSASQSVTVTANSVSTINFTLKPGPGTVTGRVISAATGLPIAGATVYFLAGSPSAVVTTATTDATGTYTTTVAAASYTLTATASGYANSAPITALVAGGQTVTAPDISLSPVTTGTLGGLVTSSSGTLPLAGVTLTIVNAGTLQAISPAPVSVGTAATASDGGQINYGPVTLPAGTYTVTATKNGVSTSSQTVTITAGAFTRLDFTGIVGLPPVHTFAAGLNFLSLPYDYTGSTFDSLFGTLNTAPVGTTANGTRSHVAVWDPTRNLYALDPNAPADAIRLGIGYWIYLKQSVGITQTGGSPAGSVSVALQPVWNQIGVPNVSGVLVSSLTFDMGNGLAPLTFAAAASSQNHVVSPTLYRFDGTAYQTVGANDTLLPWNAYWIQAFVATTMKIPTGK